VSLKNNSKETEERTEKLSLTPKVASENGAEHRFCDPHEDRRNQIRYLEQAHLHLKISMRDWNISNDEAHAKSWALALGKYLFQPDPFSPLEAKLDIGVRQTRCSLSNLPSAPEIRKR